MIVEGDTPDEEKATQGMRWTRFPLIFALKKRSCRCRGVILSRGRRKSRQKFSRSSRRTTCLPMFERPRRSFLISTPFSCPSP
ncbi:hypothetical protein CSUI_001262 [Cystoisospora suis]|uniref:Uncharacterized protein n=1 Tax=Cystoisospora suis TaxID=483139 RepID=A0A2C6KLH0_9APIC|nr:hypothetical protein CSUI_001262 [Cystoisospora suis]